MSKICRHWSDLKSPAVTSCTARLKHRNILRSASQLVCVFCMDIRKNSAVLTGRLYTQQMFLVLISVRGWVNSMAIARPESLYHLKISMKPSGIETAIFQHVRHCLNQLSHTVPQVSNRKYNALLVKNYAPCKYDVIHGSSPHTKLKMDITQSIFNNVIRRSVRVFVVEIQSY